MSVDICFDKLKVGNIYKYEEERFFQVYVKLLKDMSTDIYYKYELEIVKAEKEDLVQYVGKSFEIYFPKNDKDFKTASCYMNIGMYEEHEPFQYM